MKTRYPNIDLAFLELDANTSSVSQPSSLSTRVRGRSRHRYLRSMVVQLHANRYSPYLSARKQGAPRARDTDPRASSRLRFAGRRFVSETRRPTRSRSSSAVGPSTRSRTPVGWTVPSTIPSGGRFARCRSARPALLFLLRLRTWWKRSRRTDVREGRTCSPEVRCRPGRECRTR